MDVQMSRRSAVVLGLGMVVALAGCSAQGGEPQGTVGGGDEGREDTAGKMEYTVTRARRGVTSHVDHAPVIILSLEAVNKTGKTSLMYGSVGGGDLKAYQDGRGLSPALQVEGMETAQSCELQDGASVGLELAFELLDESSPVKVDLDPKHADEEELVGGPLTLDPSAL